MANAHASSMPARVGRAARPPIRAARVAKRRRRFVLAVGLLLFTLAALSAMGEPVQVFGVQWEFPAPPLNKGGQGGCEEQTKNIETF